MPGRRRFESVAADVAEASSLLGASGRSLALAAAPVFAAMAVYTAMQEAGMPASICLRANGASPLLGMFPMYALMSAVHAGPWLRLFARRKAVHDPATCDGNADGAH